MANVSDAVDPLCQSERVSNASPDNPNSLHAKVRPMRDYRDAKAIAQTLRDGLKTKSINITHSTALELTAKALGFKDWHVLAAKIETDRPAAPSTHAQPPAKRPSLLYCSFCGKSQHEVGKLIAGPNVFICDECVGLCDDIVIGRDPVNYADTPEVLKDKSTEELVDLENKLKLRVPQIQQVLELTVRAINEVGHPARAGAPARPDPQRDFVLSKSPQERVAYVAAIRQRVAAIDRVAVTVAGLLAERGAFPDRPK
jgi:hypothetical protein